MCGIFGYIGRISKNATLAHSLVRELAIGSEIRGVDATGFSSRRSLNGEILFDKMPVKASEFVRTSPFFTELYKEMPDTFIGHTRLGTGSSPKINNNNHPFAGSRYNMVHNGVIPSWRNIRNKHSLSVDSETDSEVILRSFEKQMKRLDCPIRSTEWVLDNVWGNMAIALLDKSKPIIWLFRNENPIVVCEVPEHYFGNPVTFFCSTSEIFKKAWKRVDYKNETPSVVKLDDHISYRLSLNSPSEDFAHLDEYEIDVRNKFKKSHQYSSYDDYPGYYGSLRDNKRAVQPRHYLSKVVNVKRPDLGNALTIAQSSAIAELVKTKEGKDSVKIDGLTIDQFSTARTVGLAIVGLDGELRDAIQTEKR